MVQNVNILNLHQSWDRNWTKNATINSQESQGPKNQGCHCRISVFLQSIEGEYY